MTIMARARAMRHVSHGGNQIGDNRMKLHELHMHGQRIRTNSNMGKRGSRYLSLLSLATTRFGMSAMALQTRTRTYR